MEARKSWDDYQNLYLNFFRYFSEHKFESPYYTALGHLLAGLTGAQDKSKWDIFDSYLTNLESIPYHLEGLTLPSRLSSSHLDYLQTRLRTVVENGEGVLYDEATSHDDLLDVFRMSPSFRNNAMQ